MKTIATDKALCIVGLGQTGLSCARFLLKQGRHFTLMDTRQSPPGLELLQKEMPHIPVKLGSLDAELLCSMDEIFLSPGLPVAMPEIQAAKYSGARIRGDIDLFSEYVNAPVIAITGSNGKSTVTTLVGEMAKSQGLSVAIGGNLGVPALDLISEEVELYVVELSSFQLETTEKLNADVVTLLNISEDHMDRYPDRLAYLNAKRRIFFGAKKVAVNSDEMLSAPLLSENMEISHFGLNGQDLKKFSIMETPQGTTITRGFEDLLPVNELGMKGRHNVSNSLAALCLGSAYGLRMDAMLSALKSFRGLPHRCEWVRTINSVDFINDSKGTNTGAANVAIESFGLQSSGKILWIAGGEGKGADFTALKPMVDKFVKVAILFGRDAGEIDEALGQSITVKLQSTLESAVRLAKELSKEGDTVLFSPACASFDMFRNYEERGDAFREEVLAL